MFNYKSLVFLFAIFFIANLPFSYANTNHETASQYIKGSTITADVKARLLADKEIKSFDISVKTEKGVVTLMGEVETEAQMDKVIAIAKNVGGVKSVKSELKIRNKNQ